jgi:TonB-dependent SusC/RagA subfamily outer membrane receptor
MGKTSRQYTQRALFVVAAITLGVVSLLATPAAYAQQQPGAVIVGQVVDSATNGPIQAASVLVEGTGLGAVTHPDGKYTIQNVPAGAHTLVARRIGYAQQRLPVTVGTDGQVTANFALKATATSLSEVIVTGTAGGQERREIGNAVSSVNATEQLSKSQSPDLGTLLNSKAPGVSIVPNSGRLGAGPNINIRGVSSLGLNNNPLIYIDGVRVSNATNSGVTTGGNGGFGAQNAGVVGRLNDISPEEIESIQIIKGPAAATIYGTEAANGVIQIITKKGAGTKPTWNFQTQQGTIYFRDPENRVVTNFAPDSTGAIIPFNGVTTEEKLGTPMYTNGRARQYTAALSGGLGTASYYLSGNFENDVGVEPNNSIRQFNGHANLNLTPSTKFDVGTSLNYVQGTYHTGVDVGLSALLGAQLGHPLVFSVPGADGFYPNVPPAVPQTLFDNLDLVNRFTGSATFNHHPVDWFTQRLIVGVDHTSEDGRGLEKFAPPELAPFTLGNASGRIGQTLTGTSLTTFDYNATAKAKLTSSLTASTSLGGQWYRTSLNESFLGGIGFPGPSITTVSGTATALPSTQGDTINTTIGGYAQEELAFNDRLYLTGALRVDNNSAFGSQFKWITYPKVSASWVVNEEPFWHVGFINTLKVRAAYGESGRAPLAYSALRSYSPVQGPLGSNAFTAGAFGNANLKPERGKEVEAGFESDLFNRLHLDFTYYNKHTTNEIVAQNIAPSSGFSGTQFQNLGQVNNHGIELQATLSVLRYKNFGWDITGTFATSHNKVISLGGLPSLVTSAGQYNVEGFPIESFFTRKVVSATVDPTTGAPSNILCDGGPGQPAVACADAPFVYIGTPTPTSTGSIGNTFTLFKKLRLYALVDWKRGNRLFNAIDLDRCSGALGIGFCDINYHPQKYSAVQVAETDFTTADALGARDLYYQDASFVKLREISATYELPNHLLPGITHASFTLAARELALWTKYTGPDPEVFVSATPGSLVGLDQALLPPLSRITATLNLTF